MTCTCSPGAPLCWRCVDAAVARCWRQAEAIGRRWGESVRRRRPGEAWPAYDDAGDAGVRLRELARRKVAELVRRDPRVNDGQVVEKLARCIGVVAGRVYAASS